LSFSGILKIFLSWYKIFPTVKNIKSSLYTKAEVSSSNVDSKAFYVLVALILLYLGDLLYSIILSAKASELFKSFMFQTFIPITALSLVSLLSLNNVIDSSTTLSLFGLSLGYTTYVVGKRLKEEKEVETES
jgi:hypothetical protein